MPGDSDPLVELASARVGFRSSRARRRSVQRRFFARVTEEMDGSTEPPAWPWKLPLAVHVRLADIAPKPSAPPGRTTITGARSRRLVGRGPILGPLVLTGARACSGSRPRRSCAGRRAGTRRRTGTQGELAGEVLEAGARLVFSKLPAVCVASDAWLMSAQGSAYGVPTAQLPKGSSGSTRASARGRWSSSSKVGRPEARAARS